MQNAWISISAPTMLIHFYCAFSGQISVQILESLVQQQQDVVRCSATVLRLANDLATSPVSVLSCNFATFMCFKSCMSIYNKDNLVSNSQMKPKS